MYPRRIQQRLEGALEAFPCVLLMGARQVGKTTLVTSEQFLEGRTYFTFDDPETLAYARSDPIGFLDQAERITIDEVQKLPEIFLRIKRKVDRDRMPGRFLLTGSSALHLMEGAQSALAGRAAILEMGPLLLSEIKGTRGISWPEVLMANNAAQAIRLVNGRSRNKATVSQRVLLGGLPPAAMLSRNLTSWQDWMRGYRVLYLERDVLSYRHLGSPEDFLRVMTHFAWRTAKLVSLSEVSRDAGVPVSSVAIYSRILELSCQWIRLPAFHRNLGKRLMKTPKGIWFDSGVAAFLMGIQDQRQALQQQRWGALFETWVANELRAAGFLYPEITGLYHWRTQTGQEIDFVLEGKGRFVPIECKAGETPPDSVPDPMQSFLTLFKREAHLGIIIYDGKQPHVIAEKVLALPASFL